MASIDYLYVRKRHTFGKQPMFCEAPVSMITNINSNVPEQKQFILRNPIHQASQATKSMSDHDANTKRVKTASRGINHTEGGWPKDIHHNDEESTARYRRKWEREDAYVNAVLKMAPVMTRYLNQNNAIEHYESYYNGMKPFPKPEQYEIRKLSAFRVAEIRPVSCIEWTNETNSKMIVAYWDTTYTKRNDIDVNKDCYLWDMDRMTEPVFILEPEAGVWQLMPSPNSSTEMAAGLANGKVCIFDIRTGSTAINTCPPHVAHRDPVSALLYIYSRSGTEFFTGSSDGQCLWWDSRNLSMPTDQLTMTLKIVPDEKPTMMNAQGISALQYDRGLPTRFLCGTETGIIININRKGKTPSEIMSAQWIAHPGPIRALYRNPGLMKMFITCGNHSAKIWSEDIKTDCVVAATPTRYQITDLAWAPQRISGYMTICKNGKLYYWDLLRSYKTPLTVFPVCPQPLTKIRPHPNGRLIGVGNNAGSSYILGVSENLQESGPNDKSQLIQIFDRANHREHILEAKLKEIRLKLKAEAEVAGGEKPKEEGPSEDQIRKEVEDRYKEIVKEELNKYPKGCAT